MGVNWSAAHVVDILLSTCRMKMSFLQYKQYISEGDLVIVCRGYEKTFPVVMKRGGVIQVKGGAIHHERLLGVEYGSKVSTSNGKNWVYVLHPTPELWTSTLPHRTQIIYSTDCSIITMQLELRPGSVVVESGTGSAALSHGLLRTIAPHGHLYTFEFHKERAEIAQAEFKRHGLADLVTLACRDVCSDGFGLENKADAVFLDLPKPWEAVESAKVALKASGGRICSFSPCIEQVQKTCRTLEQCGFVGQCQCGFVDVDVMECLQRPYSVRQWTLNVPNMGASVPNQDEPGTMESTSDHSTDADFRTSEVKYNSEVDEMETTEAQSLKRKRNEMECTSEESSTSSATKDTVQQCDPSSSKASALKAKPTKSSVKMHAAQPCMKIPGHTGFLTFATLYAETDSSSTPRETVTSPSKMS